MADMMLATTKDSTSINFGMGHQCEKHGTLFTTEHIDQCDELRGCENIARYAKKLKEVHLLDWPKEERLKAITEFTLLTVQMQNLTAQSRARLVATSKAYQHVKEKKKRGRKSNAEKAAKGSTKLEQYFTQQEDSPMMIQQNHQPGE